MKIYLIAPSEIPARRANTIQVMKMAQALASLGHDICVYAPSTSKSGIPINLDWEYLSQQYGLRIQFPINLLNSRPSFRRYDFSLAAVLAARQRKADVIYTRLPQAAALSALLGSTTIFELHDIPQGYAGRLLFRLYFKGRGAFRLVCITSALAKDIKFLSENINIAPQLVISPDGVDIERFASLPTPEQARSHINKTFSDKLPRKLSHFTAGYTGHLYPGRGVDFLLDLAERLPEINFLLAGGEPKDISELQTKVSDRNLENNVHVAGFVPNAELPLFQAACDVLLMPYQSQISASSGGDISRYLSPMKLFEYMACGRAIISSDLPVFREILNDQNAILLPVGEVESWTQTLRQLQDNPYLREKLAAQAREDAQQYTWEKRAEQILNGLSERE